MSGNIQYYFAAANSFDGFVSYFDKVFSATEFEKVYILKGGPGTGKSRFIKDVYEAFCEKNAKFEGILCSSDPKSYDGLIISTDEKKICIIDGTAPHLTDPVYPGAIEKIINLGDSWNDSVLYSHRQQIIELINIKKYSYKSAYEYLSVAKHCTDFVFNSVKRAVLCDFKSIIDRLITRPSWNC